MTSKLGENLLAIRNKAIKNGMNLLSVEEVEKEVEDRRGENIEDTPTALDWYNATYRRHARSGDIAVACDGKGFFPFAIEIVTGQPGHHTGMLFWWGDNLMVIEATADGITCGLFSQWWDRGYGRIEIYRLKSEYRKTFDPVVALNTACADMRKVKYDFQGIGNLAVYKLFGIDQRSVMDTDVASRRFCSASTARWTRHGGVDEFGKDDSLIVPGDYSISPMREMVVSLAGKDVPNE